MTNKVMIVGTGNVGASIAFAILNQRTAVREIILTDIIAKDADGEAKDLSDALVSAPSHLKIRSGTYKDAKDCDIVIISAGAAQRPNESRNNLLGRNANILKGMIDQIMDSGFKGIIIMVTNPVDTMAYLAWKFSGLPPEKIISTGTMLETARLRKRISEYIDVNPKSISAFQMGEHGDSGFSVWSLANLSGQPIGNLLRQKELAEIEKYIINEVYEIIEQKGATYYGISTCVVDIVNCILNDEKRILPISSYHEYEGVFYGSPTIIGRRGVIRQIDLKISEVEGMKLEKSIQALRAEIKSLKSKGCPKLD